MLSLLVLKNEVSRTSVIDEIDRVELIMELEEAFDIGISDQEGED